MELDYFPNKRKPTLKAEKLDPFYAGRDTMHQQLYRDSKLSRRGLRVGISISRLFNRNEFRKSGRLMAWPGEDWLAKDTRMSVRTVKRAIQDLEDRGHYRIIRGTGRKENRYIAMLNTAPGKPNLVVIQGAKSDTPGVSTGGPLNTDGNTDQEGSQGREEEGRNNDFIGFDDFEAYPGPERLQ
jgi:hypothetical protein